MHAQDLQGRGDLGLDLSGSSGVIRGQTEQAQRKGVAKKLFDYIKHNVMKSVTLSNNYDYPTRRAALDKLKNMTVQLGTPDFLTDKVGLLEIKGFPSQPKIRKIGSRQLVLKIGQRPLFSKKLVEAYFDLCKWACYRKTWLKDIEGESLVGNRIYSF